MVCLRSLLPAAGEVRKVAGGLGKFAPLLKLVDPTGGLVVGALLGGVEGLSSLAADHVAAEDRLPLERMRRAYVALCHQAYLAVLVDDARLKDLNLAAREGHLPDPLDVVLDWDPAGEVAPEDAAADLFECYGRHLDVLLEDAGWSDRTDVVAGVAARARAELMVLLSEGNGPVIRLYDHCRQGRIEGKLDRILEGQRAEPLAQAGRKTVWLPHLANHLFVGRTQELARIHERLRQAEGLAVSQIAAAGLGGIGKTQLALRYAYTHGSDYAGVHWLNMAAAVGVPDELARVGVELGLYPLDDPNPLEAKVQRVVHHLAGTAVPLLLIFDNCEEEALYRQWRPRNDAIKVLLTSRKHSWPADLGLEPLLLDVLERPASIALLRGTAPGLSEDEADRVAEALGDFPLALQLAGGYLHAYAGFETVDSYLAALAVQSLDNPSLTGEEAGTSPTGHEQSVAATFAQGLTRLDPEADAKAHELLATLGWFAPGEAIPLHLIPANEKHEVRRGLRRLEDLGMVVRESNALAGLHRLYHGWLERLPQREAVAEAVAVHLAKVADEVYESGLPQGLDPWRVHLRHLVAQRSEREDLTTAALNNALARNLELLGDYRGARPLYQRALALAEAAEDETAIATYANNLALLYQNTGDYAAAEPLYRQSLALAEANHGPEDPRVAIRLNNLAMLLDTTGRYEEPERLFHRALTIDEAALGPNHPNVARDLNNLAALLDDMGRYEEAEPLYRRALTIDEAALGPNHPNVAVARNNLASLLYGTGCYQEAEPLLRRALAIDEVALGPNHPNVAIRLNNLARLLEDTNLRKQAEPLFVRALTIFEAALGLDHPHTRVVKGNLELLRRSLAQPEG